MEIAPPTDPIHWYHDVKSPINAPSSLGLISLLEQPPPPPCFCLSLQ